jgi:uncharacterized protein YaeQ
MALPATIYRACIQLAHVDRGVYENLEVTLARHPSETEERLVARLLAYAVNFEEGLGFTRGIAAGDEPDLWVQGPDGRVKIWIEVGLPDPERLLKASRHAGQVALFAYGMTLPRWQEQHLAKLANIANLAVTGIELRFLSNVVSRLQRAINWSLTITGGTLYLTIGNQTLETHLLSLKNI